MDRFVQRAMIFFIGAFGYYGIEVLFRGYSHWTMFLTGGIAFLCLFALFNSRCPLPYWVLCLMGAAMITSIEFAVGIVVNRWLNWSVWDYSALPYNLSGQVCLLFSGIWFVLCIPIGVFSRLLKNKVLQRAILFFLPKNKELVNK